MVVIDFKLIIKRSADWLEKISVASLAVGIYQDNEKTLVGITVGIIAFLCSHALDAFWRKL